MTRKIQIDLTLRQGQKQIVVLDIPTGSSAFDALIQPMQVLCDRIIAVSVSTRASTCTKGCSPCCRQLIPLSIAEVLFLKRVVDSLPPTQQQRIHEKLRFITRILQRHGMPTRLQAIHRTPGFDRGYFDLGIPCPFLERDECSIYPQRPFVCREYHVSSSPSLCADPYRKQPERAHTGVNFGALMSVFSSKLYGDSPLPVPLFHFLDWIQAHQECLTLRFSSQWMFESLFNGLARYDFQDSWLESLVWKFVQEPAPPRSSNANVPVCSCTHEQPNYQERKQTRTFAVHGREKPQQWGGIDVNQLDEHGVSPLFLLLSNGYAAHQREMIDGMLERGAVIKNGAILSPTQLPKLLTQHANAENMKTIFTRLSTREPHIFEHDVLVEVGSGDGYLRYLLELTGDSLLKHMAERIIETEVSSQIVGTNAARGKYTLCSGIADLPDHFGERFTSCILSLNVFDIFPQQQLLEQLRILARVLKHNGLIIHIMSSAIHQRVFQDLAAVYPETLHLPFYQDGYVGIRIAAPQCKIRATYPALPNGPEALANLFAQSPDAYIQLSQQINDWFEQTTEDSRCVLLNRFSSDKIMNALQQSGFHIGCHEEIHSRKWAPRTEIHRDFEGINAFHNIAGALLCSSSASENTDMILEEATFGLIVASWKHS